MKYVVIIDYYFFFFLVSTGMRKIILTPDQFSKITKLNRQKKTNLVIPTAPLITNTTEVNDRLLLPPIKIDLGNSGCNPSTLQYNQV